ncbi:MAG: matrixin family metalloprotease [Oligoflexales bacterium]
MFALRLGIVLLVTACGNGQQFEISDEPASQTASVGATSSAFHNPNGWSQPVLFHLDSEVPEDLHAAIVQAAATWNEAIGHDVIIVDGTSSLPRSDTLYESLSDNETIVYYEPNWLATTAKPESVIATTIWENENGENGNIVRGDIILNAENYYFVDTTSEDLDFEDPRYFVDTETVVLHEFGHLLGLGHLEDDSSVMNPYTTIGLGSTHRDLGKVDITNIRSIYE